MSDFTFVPSLNERVLLKQGEAVCWKDIMGF